MYHQINLNQIIMKKFLYLSLIALFLFSCSAIPKEPICTEPIYVVGTVLYSFPSAKHTRTLIYKTNHGTMTIYNVPIDVNTIRIPVCFGYHGQTTYFKN